MVNIAFESEKKRVEKDTVIQIPSSIWKDEKLSVLEALVAFLKEEEGLSYRQISVLINRDERNVWTVYDRARKKRKADGRKNE